MNNSLKKRGLQLDDLLFGLQKERAQYVKARYGLKMRRSS